MGLGGLVEGHTSRGALRQGACPFPSLAGADDATDLKGPEAGHGLAQAPHWFRLVKNVFDCKSFFFFYFATNTRERRAMACTVYENMLPRIFLNISVP